MRHTLFVVMLSAAHVFAQQPMTLMLADFEEEPTWDGVSLDAKDARSGKRSGVWVPSEINRIRTEDIPADWSGYDRLVFWLHSAAANGQSLTVLADSENPNSDGWDYYYHHFTVDWEGWRLLSFELGDDIRGARQPVGWQKINYLMFSASGWNNTPQSDTMLRIDGVMLVRDPATLEHLGSAEERVDGEFRVTHRYAVTNRTDAPASFALSLDGDFELFTLVPDNDRTPEIAPDEVAEITVTLAAPLAQVEAVAPLTREAGRLFVGAQQEALPAAMAPISAAVPLPKVKRPLLFASQEEVDRAKDRAQRHEWARREVERIIAAGGTALKLEVVVPEEGGQWSHHYVCEDCGVRLRTQSPTEHVCSRCDKVHTGWPYDQVVVAREHHRLTNAVQDLGLAYAFTDDVRYAEKAREILLAYGERYRDFPLHDNNDGDRRSGGRLYAQTLDEAVDIIKVAWGYDLIYDSGVFSDEDRSIVEDGYLRAVAETIQRNDAGISNWQSWHNAGLAAIGFCLRDADLASFAIDGTHGLNFQLANSILSDGFWYEGTAAYHFYALSALRWTVEAAWHSGIDFYESEEYKSLYDAPMLYVFPDLTFPAVNDSDVFPLTGRASLYDLAYSRFGDERYVTVAAPGQRQSIEALLWGVEDLPTALPLVLPSHTFEALGATILRAGAGEEQTYVHFDWGPHGGGHGHPDKLALILYAMGVELAPDPGRLAYGASLQSAWYKQTVSHNTVVVDERSQHATEGRLLLAHDGGIARIARAEVDTAYDGVMLRRTLVLLDDYLLDVFELEADEEHTADLVYHNIGEHRPLLDLQPLEGPLGQGAGYQHITDVSAADVADTWQTDFAVPEAGKVRLTMLGEPNTRVFLGTGLTGRDVSPCPAVVARRQTAATMWVSAIEWRRPEAEFAITSIRPIPVTADGTAMGFRIDRTDGHDVLMLAPGVTGEKRADGLVSASQLAFFRLRGGEIAGMEQVDVVR